MSDTSGGNQGSAGTTDLASIQRQGVINIGLIVQALRAVFLTFGGKTTSATAGAASALPAAPAGYTIVTFPDGTVGKIPFYNT